MFNMNILAIIIIITITILVVDFRVKQMYYQ